MQTITTQDGATVSFTDNGDGAPIVLLHGIQGTARTWDNIVSDLSGTYRVIAPNLRGRSASSIPRESRDYRLSFFAADLQAVLNWIGQPAVLVAWSMGVSVTLEMVRTYGDCGLRGLVLVSGTPCVGDEARWFHGKTEAEVADEARERGKRLSLVEAAEPFAVAASWQNVKREDFRPILPLLKIPVLVIHGVDDDQSPISHGRMLAEDITGGRLVEWSNTGHNPMATDAPRFASEIRSFVENLS